MPALPTIRLGSQGPAVRILQMNLIGLNFNFNNIAVTGTFDADTDEALRDFQAEHKLVPDGIVGPITWGALFNEVIRVQNKLNSLQFNAGAPDGIYGPRTRDTVRRFQSVNGLVMNGNVAPRTRQQLFNPNPPDDFSKRPTNNNIDALNPYVATLARRFLALCAQNGLDVRIYSVFRSWDDQDAYYAQGRTAPGPIVTDAMGGDSYHNWGLAFDAAPLTNGTVNWNDMAKFNQMGRLGEQVGLEWGGNWKTVYSKLVDQPHFQYTFGLSTPQLLDGARPPA